MSTTFLGLSTLLLAGLMRIFALARFVTSPLTSMGSALECLATDEAAEHVGSPTWLILQRLLAAETLLLRQKRAFGALFVFGMAVMGDLRMPAVLAPTAGEVARWRACTTGQRGLEYGPATTAGNVLENRLFAAATWPSMAKVHAVVIPAFESPATDARANVLGFDVLVQTPNNRSQGFELPLRRLAFRRFLFSSTTSLTAFVPTTIHRRFAET
jgi:hypothetical protein